MFNNSKLSIIKRQQLVENYEKNLPFQYSANPSRLAMPSGLGVPRTGNGSLTAANIIIACTCFIAFYSF